MLALVHGNRVVDVAAAKFPVVPSLIWVNGPDDVSTAWHYQDGEVVAPENWVPPPPTMTTAQRLSALESALTGRHILLGVYGNHNAPERMSAISITNGSPYDKHVILSERVNDILASDILRVTAEFQVTTEHSYNVMISSQIRMGETTAVLDGPEVAENSGLNINRDIHHYARARVGVWTADADYGSELRVNVLAWSSSTAASPGDSLSLDQGKGRLIIEHFRKLL